MSGVQFPPPLFLFMENLYPFFFNNIKKFNLINNNETIIISLSGGKDSVTLTHLLKKLQKDIDFQLIAAYFNHQIREDSKKEENWIEKFCKSLNIKLLKAKEDVISFKEKNKLNLEHAGSILRYRFLNRVSSKYKNSKIATAHTKSDLFETFLIKLFRGSGNLGLSAIFTKKGNNIIRPLLIFSKEDVLNFLNRNKIQYYEDYTNKQNKFIRNKIRNTIIPKIKEIEPNIENQVFKTITIIQQENEYFTDLARKILKENLILEKILPLNVINRYNLAIKRYIIREYIRILKGDLLNIDFNHIENIINTSSESKGISIPGIDLKFHKGYIFPGDIFIPDYKYIINSYGTVRIKEINKIIKIEQIEDYIKPENNYEIVLSYSQIKFPLLIRNVKKKDKYIKINSSFNQKVFEKIRESGIPCELRNLCPLLLNYNEKIIWCYGSPISDFFKIKNKNMRKYLKITIDIFFPY